MCQPAGGTRRLAPVTAPARRRHEAVLEARRGALIACPSFFIKLSRVLFFLPSRSLAKYHYLKAPAADVVHNACVAHSSPSSGQSLLLLIPRTLMIWFEGLVALVELALKNKPGISLLNVSWSSK